MVFHRRNSSRHQANHRVIRRSTDGTLLLRVAGLRVSALGRAVLWVPA
jgi:hypothetical protein